MPGFIHPDFADGGADMLRTRAATAGRIRLRALGSYTLGASYSAVVAATIGYVSVAPGDLTASGSVGAARVQMLAGKSILLTVDDDGTGLHWAITDEIGSTVQLVAPGTSDVTPLEAGGTLTCPSSAFATYPQPS